MEFNGILLATPLFIIALAILFSRPGRRMLKSWGRGLGIVDQGVHEELNDHFLDAELTTLRDRKFQEEVKLVRATSELARLNQEIQLLQELKEARTREVLKEATQGPLPAEVKQPSVGAPVTPRRDQAPQSRSSVTPLARPA